MDKKMDTVKVNVSKLIQDAVTGLYHYIRTCKVLSFVNICNTLGMKEEDKYKDTLSSLMTSMIVCDNGATPTIKDYFTDELLELDKKYEKQTKELVSEMEKRINNVLNVDMPDCLKEFTSTLASKYYYTFNLLWLSKISGLTNCDNDCLVENMNDTKFIFRVMRGIVLLGADKELSCSGANIESCNDALKAILSDKFITDDYKKQKESLRIFVHGMIGDLENAYIDLGQDPSMDECKRNMTITCYGKLLLMHASTSKIIYKSRSYDILCECLFYYLKGRFLQVLLH